MIKVITLTNKGWNTHSLDPNIDPENITDTDLHWYENLALDNFINNGWTILDWKMSNTKIDCYWTFILYKSDAHKDLEDNNDLEDNKSEETGDLPTDILKKLNYKYIDNTTNFEQTNDISMLKFKENLFKPKVYLYDNI